MKKSTVTVKRETMKGLFEKYERLVAVNKLLEQQLTEQQRELDERRAPIPMLLTCPCCGERHIDEGEFATKAHRDHACQKCGTVWRPAKVDTVGVRFLPGYQNEERAS